VKHVIAPRTLGTRPVDHGHALALGQRRRQQGIVADGRPDNQHDIIGYKRIECLLDGRDLSYRQTQPLLLDNLDFGIQPTACPH
jgi:hypothetical protein